MEEGFHIPIETLADGVTAGLLRELAAGLASKLACTHLFSMAMIVLGITPLNRKEKKGKKMREPLTVFYITTATYHQISMLAFLMLNLR